MLLREGECARATEREPPGGGKTQRCAVPPKPGGRGMSGSGPLWEMLLGAKENAVGDGSIDTAVPRPLVSSTEMLG